MTDITTYIPLIIGVFIIIAILVFIALFFVITYNKLVTMRNRVRNQKSQIDVELKRRFDLVPNLVEVVKGYAAHEKSALEDIIKARNTYVAAGANTGEALGADNALSGALSKLFALSESYPDLKANTNFVSLQADLSGIEQKIVYSRQFYNDSVFMLNNKIEKFPSNMVANMFNFEPETFFEATDTEKENVKVSF